MTRNPKLNQSIPTVSDAALTTNATNISANVPPMAAMTPMSITCARKALLQAVRRLSAIAPKRSTMPILQNIAIRANKLGVVLAATDLNVTGVIEAPAWHVHSSGSCTVNAKALVDVLGKLSDGDITLKATMHGLDISHGAATVSLQGTPARDFPKLPAVLPDDPVVAFTRMDAALVKEALATVAYAVCKDETRFHLNGVFVEYDGAILRTVATDGHRLTKWQKPAERKGDFATAGIIVPAKGAKEICKLLARGECDIALIGTGKHQLAVRYMGTTLVVKLIDAQFPPYEQVIPKDYQRLVTVDRKALASALERAAVTCTETRGVRMEMLGETMTLVSDNPDRGETRETLAAECVPSDETFVIGCNPKYLIDALGEIDDERVTLTFDHAKAKPSKRGGYSPDPTLSPFLVRSTEDVVSRRVSEATYLGVVMPMRV